MENLIKYQISQVALYSAIGFEKKEELSAWFEFPDTKGKKRTQDRQAAEAELLRDLLLVEEYESSHTPAHSDEKEKMARLRGIFFSFLICLLSQRVATQGKRLQIDFFVGKLPLYGLLPL